MALRIMLLSGEWMKWHKSGRCQSMKKSLPYLVGNGVPKYLRNIKEERIWGIDYDRDRWVLQSCLKMQQEKMWNFQKAIVRRWWKLWKYHYSP